MALSAKHIELVDLIIAWIKKLYGSENTIILHDNPDSLYGEGPPKIGNTVPDVYAKNFLEKILIIGEAKPAYDLLSEHTSTQIYNFLECLAIEKNGMLVISTERGHENTATNMVKLIMKRFDETNTKVVILTDDNGVTKV